jgi:hypothetical protein
MNHLLLVRALALLFNCSYKRVQSKLSEIVVKDTVVRETTAVAVNGVTENGVIGHSPSVPSCALCVMQEVRPPGSHKRYWRVRS